MPPTSARLSFDKPNGEYRVDSVTPFHSMGDVRWTTVTVSDGITKSLLTFDHDSEQGQREFIESLVAQASQALAALDSLEAPPSCDPTLPDHSCGTILEPCPHDNALRNLRPPQEKVYEPLGPSIGECREMGVDQ